MSITGVITVEEWRAQSKPSARRQKRASVSVPYESEEQSRVHEWLDERKIAHFAVPNGGHLAGGGRAAKQMMAQGMLRGAPDLVLIPPAPKDGWRHVVVEMKRRTGGVVSPAQKEVHEIMRPRGWIVIVAHGFDEAVLKLTDWGY